MEPRHYLETQIMGADPVELVRILYRGAIGAIEDARRHLASGDIMARGNAISKAMDCLSELTLSLNLEEGGEMAQRLSGLYAYMQRLLFKAHAEQTEAPLIESEKLLSTLLEGWNGVQASAPAPAAAPKVEQPEEEPQLVGVYAGDPYGLAGGYAATSAGRSWEL